MVGADQQGAPSPDHTTSAAEWRLTEHTVDVSMTTGQMWLADAGRSYARAQDGGRPWEQLLGCLSFVHAVHHLRMCVQLARASARSQVAQQIAVSALEAFDARQPGISKARNVIEHFDEYYRGTGQMQQPDVKAAEREVDEALARRWSVVVDYVDGEVSRPKISVGPYAFELRECLIDARQLFWQLYQVARLEAGDVKG